jgi:hypothetical protein
MSSESEDDDKSKPPKTRGEVSAQEQQSNDYNKWDIAD